MLIVLNVEEAKAFINRKMERYKDWYFYAIKEDRDYYYFVYCYKDESKDSKGLPVFRVNKSRCTVKVLYRNDLEGLLPYFAARVFYNKKINLDMSVEERAALRYKFYNPDEYVLCPRCGEKIVWSHYDNYTLVRCISRNCLRTESFGR